MTSGIKDCESPSYGATPGRDTCFTVLLLAREPATLQSLLDTTPPKRVPVLWDGLALAPSKGPTLRMICPAVRRVGLKLFRLRPATRMARAGGLE